MTELGERIVAALEDNSGILLPAIKQLMAEAWAEGVQDVSNLNALPEAETARMLDDNPYTAGATS